MPTLAPRVSAIVLLICATTVAAAQHVTAPQAVAQLKAGYFSQDWIGAADEGARLVQRFPRSRELRAWHVLNMARGEQEERAVAAADAMLAESRNDPWGWFAKTAALEYAGEGDQSKAILDASARAYKLAPLNPDVIWIRALALANTEQAAAALALLDSAAKRAPLSVELQNMQAAALWSSATVARKVNQATRDSALAVYARVRAADPSNVTAHVVAASRLLSAGHTAEAYTLAKRGVELSPASLNAHRWLWNTLEGLKDRPQAERDAEMLADVESLLRLRPKTPPVLLAAARQFDVMKLPERKRELEDRILAEHPTTTSAEWVLVNRYRDLGTARRDSTNADSTVTGKYRRALWEFIDRPVHNRPQLLGDAYRSVFDLTDSTTNPDTLLRIVRGMVKYEGINPHFVYAQGPMRLADRGVYFREAEQIARAGIDVGKKKIASQRSIYETPGDYVQAQGWMEAFFRDALGWVAYREGRLKDAELELKRARELDPKSVRALYHLGQLAEKRGKLDDAEAFYTTGSLVQAMGVNPNRAALQTLYKARHGSLDGYDTYLANLAETDRARRKQEIAKTRIADPQRIKSFALQSLTGELVALDSLKGKVAVINNWGMWCGPCVAEMPEFQKLSQQYAGDSAVRILTIDFRDPNVDELRAWMTKKGYTYTTLLDNGYVSQAGVTLFPTTWFLDREGRLAFKKEGWSEKLVEEFGWRIEMLRRGAAVTP